MAKQLEAIGAFRVDYGVAVRWVEAGERVPIDSPIAAAFPHLFRVIGGPDRWAACTRGFIAWPPAGGPRLGCARASRCGWATGGSSPPPTASNPATNQPRRNSAPSSDHPRRGGDDEDRGPGVAFLPVAVRAVWLFSPAGRVVKKDHERRRWS
jgi:hypothetical protein